MNFDNMLDKELVEVKLNNTKDRITFIFVDGKRSFGVEGDCCSYSWIEHLELPENIKSAKIVSVDEKYMDVSEDDEFNPKVTYAGVGEYRKHECLKQYQTIFNTDYGEIVLEYRNSSNGYYGGYLVNVE